MPGFLCPKWCSGQPLKRVLLGHATENAELILEAKSLEEVRQNVPEQPQQNGSSAEIKARR